MSRKPYTLYAMPGARRRWPRVLLGTLVTLLTLAGIASGAGYLWLNAVLMEGKEYDRAKEIGERVLSEPPATTVETVPGPPDAVDILVLGSDNREGAGEKFGRSDTLMIVHVDPGADFASVLSLPRDLKVPIPGYGSNKINAAFALGGPELAIRTVQSVTGIDLDHYVNVDFEAFRVLTEELGGIYYDVEREFYYDGGHWESIDLEPGYQALAGENALDYVRFRQDQTGDFGRIERQQRFLRAVKEQAFKWNLPLKVPGLMRLVSRNVETDLQSGEVLRLAWWGAKLGQGKVKQVRLQAGTETIGGASYVIATQSALRRAVEELFLPPAELVVAEPGASGEGDEPSPGDSEVGEPGGSSSTTTVTTKGPVLPDLTGIKVSVLNGNGRKGEGGATAKFLRSLGATVDQVGDARSYGQAATLVSYPADRAGAAALVAEAVGTDRLEVDSSVRVITVTLGTDFRLPSGEAAAPRMPAVPDAGAWKAFAAETSFTLMAPGKVPAGYRYTDFRIYDIESEDGGKPSLKVVYKLKGEDQFLGLMETTFVDAPAASDGEEVKHGDLTLHLVFYEDRLDRIWWKKDGVLYWLSNTLSYKLSREELLEMAQSMVIVE